MISPWAPRLRTEEELTAASMLAGDSILGVSADRSDMTEMSCVYKMRGESIADTENLRD